MIDEPDHAPESGSEAEPRATEVAVAAHTQHVSHVKTDEPCLFCGYNLRGLPQEGACPECGRAVRETTSVARRWVFDARSSSALAGSLLLGISPVGLIALTVVLLLGLCMGSTSGPADTLWIVGVLVTSIITCLPWLVGVVLLLRVAARVAPVVPGRIAMAWVFLAHLLFCVGWAAYSAATLQTAVGRWLDLLLLSAPIGPGVIHLILDTEMAKLIDQPRRGVSRSYVPLVRVCIWITMVAAVVCASIAAVWIRVGEAFPGSRVLSVLQGFAFLVFVAAGLMAGGSILLTTWKFWIDIRRLRRLQRMRVHTDVSRPGIQGN
jgi:hypothetical protein